MFSVCYILTQRMSALEIFFNDSALGLYKCSLNNNNNNNNGILWIQTIIVLAMLFAVIVYRLAIVTALYSLSNQVAKENARIITSITASLINLVIIIILSKVRLPSSLIILRVTR